MEFARPRSGVSGLVLSEARRVDPLGSDGHCHLCVPQGLYKHLSTFAFISTVGLQTYLLYKDPSLWVGAHPVYCSRAPPSSGVAISK